MTGLLHDLRTGLRSLRAAPLTTAAAVLVIAVGVGANLAVFAVAYGILLRPLPYPDAHRLVIVSVEAADGSDFGFGLHDVAEWRRRLRTVEGVAGFRTDEQALRGAGEPRLVRTASVTDGFFRVLAVPPARGRLSGSADAGVLSHRLARRLDRDTGADGAEVVLGRPARAGDRPLVLAAVMPRDFAFPSDDVDLWLPEAPPAPPGAPAAGEPDTRSFRLVARLAPGVTVAQARDDALRVLRELRGPAAGRPGSARPRVTPVAETVTGPVRPALAAAGAAAFLVLLVTCGNVATLLLGRAAAHRADAAIRLALGAGGWRLVRSALAESLLLAVAGSSAGLGVAAAGIGAFRRAAAGVVPRADAVGLDPPVLAAGVALVAAVTALAGVAPALHVARRDVAASFGGRGIVSAGHGARRLVSWLVVAQIAASVVLLTGAALLARTVSRLLDEDAGFEPERVLTMELALSADGAAGAPDPRRSALVRQVLERVRALPGVEVAGIGSSLPPRATPFEIYVRTTTGGRDEGSSWSVVSVTAGYLEALGVRRVAGRPLTGAEVRRAASVVLLSESAARLLAPERDLSGLELPMHLPPIARFAAPPRVLGVVRDVKYAGLDLPPDATIYLPWDAGPGGNAHLAVRAAGDALALAPAVLRIVREADPEIPVPPVRTLADEMALSVADRRLRALPALGFAAVALAVALTGIFGLLQRAAAERRHELAVRMAVGASERRITAMMLGRAAALTGAGLALGLAASAAVTTGLRGLLFGVGAHDPPTFAGVLTLVAAAALLAAYVPARRAARVEPMELLRVE